jgi:hypothetical protein
LRLGSTFDASPLRLTLTPPQLQLTQLTLLLARADEKAKRHCFEVLYNRREVKFVARSREAAQPQTFKAVMGFEVCEAHLNALSFIARSRV